MNNRINHRKFRLNRCCQSILVLVLLLGANGRAQRAQADIFAQQANFVFVSLLRQHIGDNPNFFDSEAPYTPISKEFPFTLPNNVDTGKRAVLMLRTRNVDRAGLPVFLNDQRLVGCDLDPHPSLGKNEWALQIIEIPTGALRHGNNTLKIYAAVLSGNNWGGTTNIMVDSIALHYIEQPPRVP